MAVGINTNLASLQAQRALGHSQSSVTTAIQRLASGLRVNSAKDDAAGIAIAERFTSQIRGMSQAVRNANDGISLLQTAEDAVNTVTDLLQRMRELAVQSAKGTNSASDRKALQTEIDQLKAEIDRVGVSTQFNGAQIFDQSRTSVTSTGDPNVDAALEGLQNGWLENSEAMVKQYFGIEASGQALTIVFKDSIDGPGSTLALVASSTMGGGQGSNITMELDMADFTASSTADGGSAPFYHDRVIAHEMVHAIMATGQNWGEVRTHKWFSEGVAEFIGGGEERVAVHGTADVVNNDISSWGGTSLDYASGYAAVRYLHNAIKAAGGAGIKDILSAVHTAPGVTLNDAIANASSGAFTGLADFYSQYSTHKAAFIGGFDLANADVGAVGGADVDGGSVLTAETVVNSIGSRQGTNVLVGFNEVWGETSGTGAVLGQVLPFQVGADAGQVICTKTGPMNLGAMGLQSLSVGSVADAGRGLHKIDAAIAYVSSQRSNIGAEMNRFESAIANLHTSGENAFASRARILDTDFAVETAHLSRAQILQQAGAAMLAQASQLPQGVLALLR